MCPRPRAIIRGARIRAAVRWAKTLTSKHARVTASGSSRNAPIGMMPALLTRMSIGPQSFSTASRNVAKLSGRVTSTR
ncbi:hypothetical protein C1Y40_05605 [Mycobacterium talmoniae]|uniref:Uncharacterized protein n=1 Tax=Mycobacterium talmoniae TaxID=1858794 RepID=A0A2S8BC58_9MYCO|nr:hypothetical protein C1Y40_05605 [Mycobacterium talmoniae]